MNANRHRDNRPDEDAMFIPDLIESDGTVWVFWKGSLYRNGKGSAVPAAMLRSRATESEYGEWV